MPRLSSARPSSDPGSRLTGGPPVRRGRVVLRVALFLVAAVAGLVVYGNWRDHAVLQAMEGAALDWRFRLRGSAPPPPDVVILAIDERTIAETGGWPVARHVLAEAVRGLDAAGARTVAFDLMLTRRAGDQTQELLRRGNAELAAALDAAGNCVLPIAFVFGPRAGDSRDIEREHLQDAAYKVVRMAPRQRPRVAPPPSGVLMPSKALLGHAALAHVNVVLDRDGALRHLPTVLAYAEQYYPPLAIEAARRHRGLARGEVVVDFAAGIVFGGHLNAADSAMRLPINYYGPTGTFPTYSMIDLLRRELPPDALAGKLVLVGSIATGVGDFFRSPYAYLLPGVEYFATATANLLEGRFLDRSDRVVLLDALAIMVMAAAGTLVTLLPSIRLIAFAGIVLLVGFGAVAQMAFQGALIWLNVTVPGLVLALVVIAAAAMRALQDAGEAREQARQRGVLASHMPATFADILTSRGGPALDGRPRPAAVLFADLHGFTSASERLGPERTAALLRRLHGVVEEVVLRHGGIIQMFVGDGAMIHFGLPEGRPDDCVRAVVCGIELIDDMASQARDPAFEGAIPDIRVGIDYGAVSFSELGGSRQRQLTASGDTVNVASRMEAMTRTLDADIALSGAVATLVRANGRGDLLASFKRLDDQPIRGRAGHLDVWYRPRAASPPDT
ncbi:CHASE2 domain-containing protein [Oceanibacterium hippocampi]|uniref:Adenylate cyclase 1 n=1 Tax=Oceanibacterium hippocampi TaxID=745714 RepID=A0A1Y5T9C6_9PROT|nr:adenylate/guanylate cyclase domain-containing protein [Oceanibacterium hippocampi]SLN58774.1 Adenylate cyclase 1 [Oceanibacterium hippocampi]